jgi:diacylglycerol O-acyltransferase / wax synthase
MPPGDAAWLHMDRPTNRMIVTTVLWFDEQLDWTQVRTLLQERLVDRYPRFSQRVVHQFGVPWWDDDESFDLGNHVFHVALAAPGGQRELEEYVASTLHLPLAPQLPLWEMHFVDGFKAGGCAIVSRIHHCIADGVALSRVLLSLTDDRDAAAAAETETSNGHHRPGPVRAGVALVETVAGDLVHPSRIAHQISSGVAAATALGGLLALPPDHRTALRGDLGMRKQVVWSEPLQLSRIKHAAHAHGVTVNDLVLSAVSGALREHLADDDGRAPDVRAIVPVNLRDSTGPLPRDLGNRFGLVYITMPLSVADPLERLAEVQRRTAAMKHSAAAPVSFGVLDMVGRTPAAVEQLLVGAFSAKGSAVITNVVGPTEPVFLAGRRLRGTVGWPPESGDLGLGVSIISYDGELSVGLLTDEHVLPEPRLLLAAIGRELDTLIDAVTIAAG